MCEGDFFFGGGGAPYTANDKKSIICRLNKTKILATVTRIFLVTKKSLVKKKY